MYFFRFQKGYVPKTPTEEAPASLSLKDLEQLRKRLDVNAPEDSTWASWCIRHQLDKRIVPHLKYCDIVSLWTWDSAELADLEAQLCQVPSSRTW